MSDAPDRGLPPAAAAAPAPAPSPLLSWPLKRIWASRVFLGIVGVLLLVVTYQDGTRVVTPDAVHVTFSAWARNSLYEGWSPEGPCPRCPPATEWITFPIPVKAGTSLLDLYARLNDLPTQPSPPAQSCIAFPERGTYTITFTLLGVPVETATTYKEDSCKRWWLSRAGLPEWSPRIDFPSCHESYVLRAGLGMCASVTPIVCMPLQPC